MADLSDVANGLAALINATLYPAGTLAPSLTGDAIKIFQGWPDSGQLAADMNVQPGIVNISVFPTKVEKVLPLTFLTWIQESLATATISFSLSGQTLTVGGAMPVPFTPHVLALIANGQAFVYAVRPTDTLATIAAALQGLIAAGIAGTTLSDLVITLPSSARPLAARVGVTGTAALPVRRQLRVFQITVWANRPEVRDRVAAALDAALSGVYRLALSDGSTANLMYQNSLQDDNLQRQTTYRRELFFAADYQTIQFQTQTQIVAPQMNVSATPEGSTIADATATVFS